MGLGGRLSVPPETLVGLRRRLDTLPERHPDRANMIKQAAALYGVSTTALYRQLRTLYRPRPLRRVDRGRPRKVPVAELERWCAGREQSAGQARLIVRRCSMKNCLPQPSQGHPPGRQLVDDRSAQRN